MKICLITFCLIEFKWSFQELFWVLFSLFISLNLNHSASHLTFLSRQNFGKKNYSQLGKQKLWTINFPRKKTFACLAIIWRFSLIFSAQNFRSNCNWRCFVRISRTNHHWRLFGWMQLSRLQTKKLQFLLYL